MSGLRGPVLDSTGKVDTVENKRGRAALNASKTIVANDDNYALAAQASAGEATALSSKCGTQPMEDIMGLKLMLDKGDKILIGDDIIVSVLSTGRRPQLQIDAPHEVKLKHIKLDPDRMFLNRKKGA